MDEVVVATLDHRGRSFFREARDIRAEIEVVLQRAGGDDADRQAVDEWFANQLYRGGHRGRAAREYLATAIRHRSPGNVPPAVGALFGDRGMRAASAVLERVGSGSHLDVDRTPPCLRARLARRVPGCAMTVPVLVVGVPRSGTTWVAETLATAAAGRYLEEPDNHFRFAFAFRAKHRLGSREYPYPAERANAPGIDDYDALWRSAFSREPAARAWHRRRRFANAVVDRADSRRVSAALARSSIRDPDLVLADRIAVPERSAGGGPLVVKSVYAALAAEWIASRHDVRVVAVLRNPLNVVSSWVALDWLPPSGPDALSTLDPAMAEELADRYEAPPPARSTLARAGVADRRAHVRARRSDAAQPGLGPRRPRGALRHAGRGVPTGRRAGRPPVDGRG